MRPKKWERNRTFRTFLVSNVRSKRDLFSTPWNTPSSWNIQYLFLSFPSISLTPISALFDVLLTFSCSLNTGIFQNLILDSLLFPLYILSLNYQFQSMISNNYLLTLNSQFCISAQIPSLKSGYLYLRVQFIFSFVTSWTHACPTPSLTPVFLHCP